LAQAQTRESKKDRLLLRARMVRAVRDFFARRGYLEVETPLLVQAPAPEVHIRPMEAEGLYLSTSPELFMKRLLALGYGRLFQITKCFRKGERGPLHLPEFTLLEWYRQGSDYRGLMEDCQDLVMNVAVAVGCGPVLSYRGHTILLEPPWDRITVREAFRRYATISLEKALEGDQFDRVMVDEIEPFLGLDRPLFLYDYPAPLAALARLKKGDPSVAERVELYIGGLELANGFSELTDPLEQRRRFEQARKEQEAQGLSPSPLPLAFLEALTQMPEAAGMALGIDRLAMLLSGATRIDQVVAFTHEDL